MRGNKDYGVWDMDYVGKVKGVKNVEKVKKVKKVLKLETSNQKPETLK